MNPRYQSLETNEKLVWNFRDISHTMRRIAEGKASQKRILILLREHDGMTQKALTDRLGVQPGTVSEVLGKLEAAGLLLRTANEADRRTTDLWLTEEGKAQAHQAYFARVERHCQMFSGLSDAEKTTLLRLLEKVNGDWEQRYQKEE